MSVLITGGLGFIGTHLATHLLRQGTPVTLADIAPQSGQTSALDQVRGIGSAELIRCDVSRPDHAARLMGSRPFEHVIHLAGVGTVEQAQANPGLALATNVTGTINMMRECIKQQPQLQSFVMLSSVKVYGNQSADQESVARTEDINAQPVGVYGQSVWMAEQALSPLLRSAPFATTVLRAGNIIGPWDHSPTRLLPSAGRRLFDSHPQPPILHGQAEQHFRYFLDVDDLIRAWEHVVGLPDGGVFNLVPERPTRIADLLDLFVEVAATEVSRFSSKRAAWLRDNGVSERMAPQDVAASAPSGCLVDGSRLSELTGYTPSITLEASVRRIVTTRMGNAYQVAADAARAEPRAQSASREPWWLKSKPDFVGPFAAAAASQATPAARQRVSSPTW